ncbi:hypothetical protein [Thalassobacter stenotrophicus]|uniref:hypothetical protein n=1 Tax=Thalassobacter stenotrophicus TaxID=266809 RepID=UPI00056FC38F|nr:hypothetical protein [Thalassobacter stenotrophicus]
MYRIAREEKIRSIVRSMDDFGDTPLKLDYDDHVLCWYHPITNEGSPDLSYFVFSIQGSEIPPIWSFQGDVDIENVIKRFDDAKVKDIDLTLLEQAGNYIVRKARPRLHWIPK